MSNAAKTLANVSKIIADHMVAAAHRVAEGLISVEASARRIGYYQGKVERALPGLGGLAVRLAAEAIKAA